MNENQIFGTLAATLTSAALAALLLVSGMETETSAPSRGSVFAPVRTERLTVERSESASDPREDSLRFIVSEQRPQRAAVQQAAPADSFQALKETVAQEALRDAAAPVQAEQAPKMDLALQDVPRQAEATVQAMLSPILPAGAQALDEQPRRAVLAGGRGMFDGMNRRFDPVVTQGR